METFVIVLLLLSLLLIIAPFTKLKIFFVANGILLHIFRFIALLQIIVATVGILNMEESRSLLGAMGSGFSKFIYLFSIINGFIFLIVTQLTIELHQQIIANKKNIKQIISSKAVGVKSTEVRTEKDGVIFILPSEKLDVFCPSCNAIISNQKEKCPNCNISLIDKVLINANCVKCGTRIPDYKTKFCTKCGNPIK